MENKEVKKPEGKKKLSYEDLENVCHQLSEQARSLYSQLQEANMTNTFKRLDYLFAVIENSDKFNAVKQDKFVNNCISEIIEIMAPVEPKEEK